MLSPEDAPTRVLVTGAGGPAAIGLMKLVDRADVEIFAADMDGGASGLYLVPAERRVVVPAGDHPHFVDAVRAVCRRHGITLVVPTVDAELLPLARAAAALAQDGITVLTSSVEALETCLDKALLVEACDGPGTPRTEVLTTRTPPPQFPTVVKPRCGSGSRGVRVCHSLADLRGVPLDGSYIIQEYLPGEELSVDVFVRADGAVCAAVPRTRDRVDSGVAVAGRTLDDPPAIELASRFARVVGLRGVANVQLRRRADGSLALLEINPRVPGSLVLSAAAGADLASLLVGEALGDSVPDSTPFREVAMVRYLTEVVVDLTEYTLPMIEDVA